MFKKVGLPENVFAADYNILCFRFSELHRIEELKTGPRTAKVGFDAKV
jgi:hypothetical protein